MEAKKSRGLSFPFLKILNENTTKIEIGKIRNIDFIFFFIILKKKAKKGGGEMRNIKKHGSKEETRVIFSPFENFE